MNKLLLIGLAILTMGGLTACTDLLDSNQVITVEGLSSEESLATLSYLSTGFLDFENTSPDLYAATFLSATEENETVIEGELDEVNIYVDRLKALIDNGVESFGSFVEEVSDNELYQFKMTFTVNEEVYIIYYSIDEVTSEMTGIILIGDVEYEFEVVDNIKTYEHHEEEKNEKSNKDDDDDEVNGQNDKNNNGNEQDKENDDEIDTEDIEEEENEVEQENEDEEDEEVKMVLIATNGEDTIKIIYKSEIEEDENTTKFFVEETINGVTTKTTLKISQEENEYKVKITAGEDEYTFKRELDEEGLVYRLEYEVDGVKGMVTITVLEDEEGNITYDYFIQEAGREKHQEKEEPHSNGFDEEDENEENTEA